jgi:hypothetical protein
VQPSYLKVLHLLSLYSLSLSLSSPPIPTPQNTKEKTVKFASSVEDRSPTFTSKEYVLRKRLTREEKYYLYKVRPDLDLSRPTTPQDDDKDDSTPQTYQSLLHREDSLDDIQKVPPPFPPSSSSSFLLLTNRVTRDRK